MQPNQKKIGGKKDFRNYDLVFASMKTRDIEIHLDKIMHVVLNVKFLEQLRDLRKPINNKSLLKNALYYLK